MSYRGIQLNDSFPAMILVDDCAVGTTWTAFSILYTLWCASWLANIFERRQQSIRVIDLPEGSKDPPNGTKPEVPNQKLFLQSALNRLASSQEMLGDLVHMLLPALAINMLASGSDRAAMVISVFFMAFGISTLMIKDPYARDPYGRLSLQKVVKSACPVLSVAIVGFALYQGHF